MGERQQTVLLAEDFTPTRILLEGLLQDWNYQVVAVEDGDSAWEILSGPNPPGMALLDWLMPGQDGPTLCKRLKSLEDHPFIYKILVTNRDEDSDLVQALDAGADDFVAKPVVPEVLRSRVEAGRRLVQAQQSLAEQHAALSALLSTLPDAVCVIDSRGAIRQTNRAADELLKSPVGDFSGCAPMSELVHPDGRVFEIFRTPLDKSELVMARDITARKARESKRLTELQELSARQLRELTTRMMQAQENEKEKLAWEIHDGLLQSLCGASMLIRWVEDCLPPEHEVRGHLGMALDRLESIDSEGRRLMWGLRPAVLDEYGLRKAVELEADRLVQSTGWEVALHIRPGDQALSHELETNLFRMIQEALSNARKHSHGPRVSLTLGEDGGGLRLAVEDSGPGFDPTRKKGSGLGLTTLTQRAETFGGWCRIESEPGQKTTVEAWLPVNS